MKRLIAAAILALVSGGLLFSCQQQQVTAEEALSFLDSLEMKLGWLDYRIGQESWELHTEGQSDSLDFFHALYTYVITDKSSLKRLERSKHLLKDEVDKRRWDLLYSTFLLSQVEAKENISGLRDSLASVNTNYRAEFEGERCSAGFLYHTYCTDRDRVRCEMAYRASRSVGLELADGLGRLFRLRNQEAHRLGYKNYLAMVFSREGLEPQEYLALLRQLDSLSEKQYESILDEIKSTLGLNDLEIWDFAYAFSDIDSKVDSYFPADSQLLYIKRSLKEVGFNLDQLPIYFDLTFYENKPQLACTFPIKPPYDIRVLANVTDGLCSMRALLHEIGHALHFACITQDRPLLASTMSGGWMEGTAQVAAALCDEKGWLEKYAHVPTDVVSKYLAAKREQDIIRLRATLLSLYFEYEAYTNPNRDLNKLYWDLFEKYLKLPRHDEIKPWAAIIDYTTYPVYSHNHLIADIIAAQTTDYFKRSYGTVIDNPMVGSFLIQNYFRFGSRYDWRELLERGTGENLNADYLVERLGI